MAAEQIEVNRIRMVEVVVTFLLCSEMTQILVICILRNYHHLLFELLGDSFDYSSFTRARASGDTDYHHNVYY